MNWLRNWKKMGTNMLPNWYGIDGIKFEWRGAMSTPLLHYKGRKFYDSDIEDALWDNYVQDGGNTDNDDEWVAYASANAVNYLEDVIFAIENE